MKVVAYTGLVSATKATVITISIVTTRRLIRHLPKDERKLELERKQAYPQMNDYCCCLPMLFCY